MANPNIYKDPEVTRTLDMTSILVKKNQKKPPTSKWRWLEVLLLISAIAVTYHISK